MKPEQLNWSDEQWAAHLGCAAHEIFAIRKSIHERFYPWVARIEKTNTYALYITMTTTLSGRKRKMSWGIAHGEFDNEKKATQYANEIIIPGLELNPNQVDMLNIPSRALQMLHIKNQKQK